MDRGAAYLDTTKEQILACDFFTVETIWLKTIYVLFLIELGTRRVYLAGCTTNPDATWITQQARQLVWDLKDDTRDMSFLIHDNDTKFTPSFDSVFTTEGTEIIHTLTKLPGQMLSLKGGYGRFAKSVSIISWSRMRAICAAFSKNMLITSTTPVHIRAWDNTFLCPGQQGTKKDRFVDEISWEVSSTIITGSLPLRFLAMDRIFAPYRVTAEGFEWILGNRLESRSVNLLYSEQAEFGRVSGNLPTYLREATFAATFTDVPLR